jgi:hypothetical protein
MTQRANDRRAIAKDVETARLTLRMAELVAATAKADERADEEHRPLPDGRMWPVDLMRLSLADYVALSLTVGVESGDEPDDRRELAAAGEECCAP